MKWATLFPPPISNLLIHGLSLKRIAREFLSYKRKTLSTFHFTTSFVSLVVVDKSWKQLKNLTLEL